MVNLYLLSFYGASVTRCKVYAAGLLPVRQADPGPAGERSARGEGWQLQGHPQDSRRDLSAYP
jgi:hypothetical protein